MSCRVRSLALILVSLAMLCAPLAPGRALADSAPVAPSAIYIVRAGDTLYNIALRYHTNVTTLAQLNGLTNPGLIYVGQRLIVPDGAPAAPTPAPAGNSPIVHTVQPGETLFRIALWYGATVWSIVSANQLENSSLIYAGQRLIIPTGEVEWPGAVPGAGGLPAPFVSVEIAPSSVVQGHVLAITVRTVTSVTMQASFLDGLIPFASEAGAYHTLIGVHAMQKAGTYPLVITATDAQGRQVAVSMDIPILAGKYGSEVINLPLEKQALLDPALINAERDKLWSVFSLFRPQRYWSGLFGLPVQGKISSVFGTRRSYTGGLFNSYHEGLDFSAGGGTPVYAPNAGVVALAEPLAVRGNAVILDHGWGVHSGFYHLSKIEVAVGQPVRAGDVIGRVGNTGLSTGAHLHWDLRVRGTNVDPLEWVNRVLP